MKSARPKRQFSCSGTIETINLDSVPQALARLDNSAAKHKLSVKPKKQRMSRQHKRLTKVLNDPPNSEKREITFETGYKITINECTRIYRQRT